MAQVEDMVNKYPCTRCGKRLRVAFEQEDALSDDKRVFLVCENCYYTAWVRKSTFDNFIKEDRVV